VIQAPTTLIERVRNLKVAVDQDALLEMHTASDEQLKAWFGGSKISRDPPDPSISWRTIYVEDFFDVAEQSVADVSFFIRINLTGRGQFMADLDCHQSYEQLSFDNVVAVLGEGWENHPYFPPPSGRIFKTPTHPRGNSRIRYTHEDALLRQEIILEFREDGTLLSLFVNGEGR
jgi:hypothetical protein